MQKNRPVQKKKNGNRAKALLATEMFVWVTMNTPRQRQNKEKQLIQRLLDNWSRQGISSWSFSAFVYTLYSYTASSITVTFVSQI